MAETTLAIAAVVGAVAAVGGTVMSVQATRATAKAQRNAAQQAAALEMEQYQEERKAAALQAQQEQAAILRDSQSAAAALIARRAANGLDPYGGSGRALLDETLEDGAADLELSRANAGRVTGQIGYAERASQMRASNSMVSATLNSRSNQAASIFSGIGSVANAGGRYLSTAK